MTQSLLTGASGLLAHQQKLDVVANNLANLNTTSYKSQRILFADLLYNTFQAASGPSGVISGGTNSKQIGNGVNTSQVTKSFNQGILTNTGQAFDFAIQGDGFFVVSGTEQKFTRDGAFSVNNDGYLVDPSTGDYVQRFGTIGEGTDSDPTDSAYQVAGDNRIFIPLGASVSGTQTTEASFVGNLPATATPPLAEILSTAAPLESGGSAATATTLLNALDNNSVDYAGTDAVEISGTNADGSTFTTNFSVGAATTVGDLLTAINGQLSDATATLSTDGNIVITADNVGEALLSLNLQDVTGNTGQTDFTENIFITETEGKGGDTVVSTIQVFDQRGQPHPLQVSFEKVGNNSWNATFRSPNADVTLADGSITNIVFDENGNYQTINGTGAGDASIELNIDTLTASQTITVALDRMTHLSTSYAATFEQDGFPPGNIVSISTSANGILTGIATNGRQIDVAQLAVANFANDHGLESDGQNYYVQTANSGIAVIGAGQTNGSGDVKGGQLENSNVDVALEFTQLIIAQRGFSANARTITVASEVLQELNQILR